MTLFIILGLVIVATVVMLYVFRADLLGSEFDKLVSSSLAVPDEAEELHSYISDCVEEVVSEPIRIMGIQGGYIDIPEDPIGRGDHNQFSNSLEIFPDTDFETAYWFYIAANGVSQSQVPDLETMESVLAAYVDGHLMDCANDQDVYEENNATVGEVNTQVEILDDEVQFIIDYPVTVNLEEFSFDFEKFYLAVDVPLGEMYQKATEVMEEENENFYLEELTYDMFVLYEELPLSWTEFDCEQETWEKDEVEEDLKTIIMNNLLAVKIQGSQYDISAESDKVYFEWDAFDGDADLRANLWYSEEWPLSLQVYPLEEDGTLLEDTYTGATGFGAVLQNLFCVTQYNFVYDLQYPVLISLYDPESDYTFQFATMVVLDNNQPRENTEGLLELDVGEGVICEDATSEVTVYAEEVLEDGSLVELEDVDISFKCITDTCSLGQTEGSYGNAELETLVPPCVNGQFMAEKDGFNVGVETVTTLEETTVSLVLEKFYEMDYEIVVIDEDGNERDTDSDDTIIITLTEQETGYTTTVSHPKNGETVTLVPGNYELVGTLVTESPFDIEVPASSYEKCTSVPLLSLGGLFGLSDDTSCIDVEVEGSELSSGLSGGLEISWNPDRDELTSAESVTFYVTSPGTPSSEEELESVYAYLDTQLGMKEPEFS